MAFSAEQLQAMETAAASGQLRVQYGDKTVVYQNLDMLLKAIAAARNDIASASQPPAMTSKFRYRTAVFDD